MDTKVTDIVLETTEVTPSQAIKMEVTPKVIEPEVILPEQTIEVTRKEYSIVGDGVYIQTGTYEDAPEWIKNAIDTSINLNLNTTYNSLTDNMNSILSVFATSYVPLDTYETFVVSQDTAYESLHGLYESLNSNYQTDKLASDARILNLEQTYTTENQSRAYAQEEISSSLNSIDNTSIGGKIVEVSDSITTLENTLSSNHLIVMGYLNNPVSGLEATSTALQTLQTYVGVTGVSAEDNNTLIGYFTDGNGNIGGATSQLVQDMQANAEVVENKFAYNSTLNLNGVYYNSGFGLKSLGTATNEYYNEQPIYDSEFWVTADKFKLTTTGYNGPVYSPFNVDGSTGDITFIGKVTFGSGQTGTIDEAIAAVVETVAVGDKNINISDNLIPTTSLVADTNNAGYQFVGTPTKSNAVGIDTFAEPQIVLDSPDEVYSPYVDEMTIAYYYRFGIKGITDLNEFFITLIDSSNNVTYNNVTYTMLDGYTLSDTEWYIVDGIINPAGGNTEPSGSIRLADGTKIGTVNNYAIASGSVKLLLGWTFDATISRMKLAKITADTITGAYATTDYVNTTTIDGGRIITSTVDASKIDTTDLIVQRVGTDLGTFGISAYKDVGPSDDMNYNIYGAAIYGGVLKGTYINGSVIAASYILSTNTFDAFSLYTGCLNYPDGMPILYNLDSEITQSKVSSPSSSVYPITTGFICQASFASNIFGYASCDTTTVNKLHGPNTTMEFSLSTVRLASSNYKRNDDSLGDTSSLTPLEAFTDVSFTFNFRGQTYSYTGTTLITGMTNEGTSTTPIIGTGYNYYVTTYSKYITIADGYQLKVQYTDGGGYVKTTIFTTTYSNQGKTLSIDLVGPTTTTNFDTGLLADDIFTIDYSATINQIPDTPNGGVYGFTSTSTFGIGYLGTIRVGNNFTIANND